LPDYAGEVRPQRRHSLSRAPRSFVIALLYRFAGLGMVALKVAMLVDALRHGLRGVWLTVIIFAPFGEVIYLFMVLLPRRRQRMGQSGASGRVDGGHQLLAFRGGDFQRGRELLDEGDHAGAAEVFEALIERAPDDARVHMGFGRALVGLGRHEEAVPYLEQFLARDPDSSDHIVRVALADALVALERGDEAVDVLGDLVTRSKHPEHRYQLARQLHALGRDLEAREELERLFGGVERATPDRQAEVAEWVRLARALSEELESGG